MLATTNNLPSGSYPSPALCAVNHSNFGAGHMPNRRIKLTAVWKSINDTQPVLLVIKYWVFSIYALLSVQSLLHFYCLWKTKLLRCMLGIDRVHASTALASHQELTYIETLNSVCLYVVLTMSLTAGERVLQWLFLAVSGFFYGLFVLVSPRRRAEKVASVTEPLLLIPAVQLAEKIRRRQVCTSAPTPHTTPQTQQTPQTTSVPRTKAIACVG